MRKILLILTVALTIPPVLRSQEMNLVRPGPLGRPVLVRGEGYW